MIPDKKKDVLLLSSGKLYELDLASNVLEEHGIPHYKQQQTVTGLRLAMPFQPFAGPGVWYAIYVNEFYAQKAKDIISDLPFEITTSPEMWHFNPSKRAKKFWRFVVFLWLGTTLVLFIKYVFDMLLTK
jgi:hypothetical protein